MDIFWHIHFSRVDSEVFQTNSKNIGFEEVNENFKPPIQSLKEVRIIFIELMVEEPAETFYEVDSPKEVTWWDEVTGNERNPDIVDVFEEADIGVVYGQEERFIHPIYAFTDEKFEAMDEAVSKIYGEDYESFVNDVISSDIHPQHSKQIERYAVRRQIEASNPVAFGEYDGFPVDDVRYI